MRTIRELKAAGFVVQPYARSTGITEIVSSAPFWFYDARLYSSTAEILDNLEPARNDAPRHYFMLLKGLHDADFQVPFSFLDTAARAALVKPERCAQSLTDMPLPPGEAPSQQGALESAAYAA